MLCNLYGFFLFNDFWDLINTWIENRTWVSALLVVANSLQHITFGKPTTNSVIAEKKKDGFWGLGRLYLVLWFMREDKFIGTIQEKLIQRAAFRCLQRKIALRSTNSIWDKQNGVSTSNHFVTEFRRFRCTHVFFRGKKMVYRQPFFAGFGRFQRTGLYISRGGRLLDDRPLWKSQPVRTPLQP